MGQKFYLKAKYFRSYCYKDILTFLQTMRVDDMNQNVKFSLNPDVKLFKQSLGHIGGASVLLF